MKRVQCTHHWTVTSPCPKCLERERDEWKARAEKAEALADVRGGEWCLRNRSEGRGGCGACAVCCNELRERAEKAESDAKQATAKERARIVAWLRSDGAQVHVVGVNGLDGLRNVADAIERGEE